jgi:hypothetical protein
MRCRTSCFAGPARNGLALPVVEAVPGGLKIPNCRKQDFDVVGRSAKNHFASRVNQSSYSLRPMAMIHDTGVFPAPFSGHRLAAHGAQAPLIVKRPLEVFKTQAVLVL